MPIDGIDESGRTRVYRKIIDQLKTNPALQAAGVEWMPFDGSTEIAVPIVGDSPVIVLRPTLGPMRPHSPDAQEGDMVVEIVMYVPSEHDACDCMDLWAAVEQAIYPFNDREKQLAFQLRLKGCEAGGGCDCETGTIKFDQPATIAPQFDGDHFTHFVCVGSMSISVLRTLNP